ncbi:phosphoketolase [Auriculariales sp. MPI-PUGE-AT-0066]|nr:phosphoketolase [Auriculariales sp. MPI-PUGE-AT-0066]
MVSQLAITPPKPSQLDPKVVGPLLVHLDVERVADELKVPLDDLLAFQRAYVAPSFVQPSLTTRNSANYLSTAQIYLQKNALLTRPLEKSDVKPRLLGHFGTCPGLNLVYAHMNLLLKRHQDLRSIYVTGPGHGAPAVLACLYLEGSLSHFYPNYPVTADGFEKLTKSFSWPGGFPSHVNAETPGAIHEGGELGYALAVSYGSVMDKPDLVTVCVIGDGEAETGPTAAAWQGHKYIDPAESGAVLPILHANGFKISERTIMGTADDLELAALFTGYGYQPRIVGYGEVAKTDAEDAEKTRALNLNMAVTMEWALSEIRKIQQAARSGQPITKPRWPMIVLRTPKGHTGPRELNGKTLVGSYRSHQVPLTTPGSDDVQFRMLEAWLNSYDPKSLFNLDPSCNAEDFIVDGVKAILPEPARRLGLIPETYKGYIPLDVPPFQDYGHERGKDISAMKAVGMYLEAVVEKNPTTFRIFSPDEFASNKLDSVLEKTGRNFQWDPETANSGGRVVEMLSEHTLQGFVQGYTLTGRTSLFPSYEAFLGIVTTMMAQFAKFQKMARETSWRGDTASITYIETSTLWRQEHNGYSHQNPAFIGALLNLRSSMSRVYLPPDANTAVSVMAHCLRSKNYVNLIVGSKAVSTNFLSVEEAEKHCIAGVSVWERYSTDGGKNPDVVLVGIGVETTIETIAAAHLLQKEGVRVRTVNVVDLMVLSEEHDHPHALTNEAFTTLFGSDLPCVINYHGYPRDVKGLLFSRNQSIVRKRFEVLGYLEQGTTTTPWMMLSFNDADRFSIAQRAIALLAVAKPNHPVATRAHLLESWYLHQKENMAKYALEHGEDSPEVAANIASKTLSEA